MQSVSAGREAGGPGSAPPPEEERDPIDRALRASRRAYAPYSRFRVGAVLEDGRGRLYEGCNLECASLGMSVCAERTALGVAWTDGARSFRRIWIYTPTPRATVPCGACRELLARHAPDLEVVLLSLGRRRSRLRLAALLPEGEAPPRRRR